MKIEKAMQRICKYMRINHTREIAYYSKIIERYLKNEIRMDTLPICGSKTHDRIRSDTIMKNYPLYCPKCKQETLINVKELQVTVIKEPDA